MSAEAKTNIITKLLTEKKAKGWFGPVDGCPGIEIAEVVGGANRNAEFAFLYIFIMLILGFYSHRSYQEQTEYPGFDLHTRKIKNCFEKKDELAILYSRLC